MVGVWSFLVRWVAPLLAVPVLYAAFQAMGDALLGVRVSGALYGADLTLHLALALLLLATTRNRVAFAVMLVLLMGVIHLGNAMKIAVLGGPVMPDDLLAARSLFLILEGWWLVLGVVAVAALLVGLALSVTLRPWRARIALAAGTAAVAVVVLAPQPVIAALDKHFGTVVWDQHANYVRRGPLLHMVHESARFAARSDRAPTVAEVREAARFLADALPPETPTAGQVFGQKAGRNLHLILLESFWDPALLTHAGLSADPFVPEFRALWEDAGNSTILAPVFGGYTANSEFEVLCGYPVTEDAVFFEGRLRNDVPCLPRLLADAGYRTLASHPNAAVFWNRVNAYRRIGFETYWSSRDFDLDDMNGDFLGDASLYRQVMDRVGPMLDARAADPDAAAPVFNYILTFFGHLDYPLNDSRPPVITAENGDERLSLYANTVYYKSLELMEVLADLQARDPDALIVVFGDHLPFLGPNFGGYVDNGLLAPSRGAFSDEMFRTLTETPLIVIDGHNGPLALGAVPLYQLPSIILDLLGHEGGVLADLTRTAPDFAMRPLPGQAVVVAPEATVACRDETIAEPCVSAKAWLGAVQTLSVDMFSGAQHALSAGVIPPRRQVPEPDITEPGV